MRGRCSHRRGLTIIELIVVAAVVAMLMAIALPAAMMAREAARRTACANHFRQVGLGTDEYVAAFGCYPPNAVTPWTVAVSPHLEQSQYYSSYDHRFDPFSDVANASLGTQPIPEFTCPSDNEVRVAPFDWVSSNVAGNVELFRPGRRPESCTDGASGTGLCVEVSTRKGLTQIEGPALFLGVEHSVHPGGFQVLFAGGSVRLVSTEIAPDVMRAIGTPGGGEIVSGGF
jgi:prepilin-type N-terminal cleavage/methylation domain-containing protein/prepilin-type processing-associated H-X9-DG protein